MNAAELGYVSKQNGDPIAKVMNDYYASCMFKH